MPRLIRSSGAVIGALVLCVGIAMILVRQNRLIAQLADAKSTVKLLSDGFLSSQADVSTPPPTVSLVIPDGYVKGFPEPAAQPQSSSEGLAVRTDTCARYLRAFKEMVLGSQAAQLPVLFEFSDVSTCPTCVGEATESTRQWTWADAHVPAITIVSGVRPAERAPLAAALTGQPVIFEESNATFKACGIRQTPIAALFDAAGALLWASRVPVGGQERLRASVLRALNHQ